MKLVCLFCLTILAALAGSNPAWADEAAAQPEPPAEAAQDTSPATGQQGIVLGQSPATSDEAQSKNRTASSADHKAQEAQALFEESLRQMMPLDESQIQEYRQRSDQRDRALLPVRAATRRGPRQTAGGLARGHERHPRHDHHGTFNRQG